MHLAASARSLRWLALPATVIVFAVGVWVAGGVLTDSFRASMALVALWYAVAAVAAFAVGRRSRRLALPLASGYVLSAGAVAVVLGVGTLRDRVVDENVLIGPPASRLAASPRRPVAVTEVAGAFTSGEHVTRGRASVVRSARGRRVLTLTGFETAAGPDLRVRVVPGTSTDGGATGAVDLGALKGNRGDQQYELPPTLDARGSTVVVWCRAFSASFGSAVLRPA
jgi:electron transfer DM13